MQGTFRVSVRHLASFTEKTTHLRRLDQTQTEISQNLSPQSRWPHKSSDFLRLDEQFSAIEKPEGT